MENFTFDEVNLICIYDPGTRQGLIAELERMKGYLKPEEAELRTLTDSTLGKLRNMTDAEYNVLDLVPDFG